MATKNDKAGTVTKEHKEKIEGMQEAAELQDAGITPVSPVAGVPPISPGKGEKRLFEVSPGNKVYLTEAEATKKGFFWRPDPTDARKSKR